MNDLASVIAWCLVLLVAGYIAGQIAGILFLWWIATRKDE